MNTVNQWLVCVATSCSFSSGRTSLAGRVLACWQEEEEKIQFNQLIRVRSFTLISACDYELVRTLFYGLVSIICIRAQSSTCMYPIYTVCIRVVRVLLILSRVVVLLRA
jgi:hypothetical protein